jgi:mRNA interferase RelE/StbE
LTKPSRQLAPEPKYRIQIDRDAEKTLRRQGRTTKERLVKAILVLADNPHPPNSRKLEGYDDLFRLRVGDWRIIYQIIDDQLLILVLEIGSRGEIYRGY